MEMCSKEGKGDGGAPAAIERSVPVRMPVPNWPVHGYWYSLNPKISDVHPTLSMRRVAKHLAGDGASGIFLIVTIAACHVSPDGVVLGADSASTLSSADGICHLDHAQKVFEVGQRGASVGLVTWGLGQIGGDSHRTIAAELGHLHETKPFSSMEAFANGLAELVWERYANVFSAEIARFKDISKNFEAGTITQEEIKEAGLLMQGWACGYCLAGRVGRHGRCEAYEILWGVHLKPQVRRIDEEAPVFWGVPQIMERLVFGIDSNIVQDIMTSGKWTGTQAELVALTSKPLCVPRLLPIREAIDWVHTIIHTTIRGTKFANWPHWCGGPVEIAAITTDRPFRWVRHKNLDAAILTAGEVAHG